MAVTIRDVARESGVSTATVSRCYNGGRRVSSSTMERVLTVAERLGYLPSRTARGLVTGRAGNIVVVLPDVTNPFFAPLLSRVQLAAQRRGIGVFLADSAEDPDTELDLVRRTASQVDGVLLVSSRLSDEDILAVGLRLPVVLANRVVAGMDAAVIAVHDGFRQAVEHLAALGHERLLYLDGPAGSWSGRRKLEALRTTALAEGVAVELSGPHRPVFASGRLLAEQVLATGCTAVVAYDDLMAHGLLTKLAELGVPVPTQVSVVGCDDALPEGMASPALTTVRASAGDMGEAALGLLLRRIGEPSPPGQVVTVPAELVVRASTGPAPGRGPVPLTPRRRGPRAPV